jgi:hypothetical protein
MSMPGHITVRVEEALAALYRHPERALLAWYRYAIYTALAQGAPLRGYAARAWLDVIAVQHVLFCWQADRRGPWSRLWPQPAQLLALAEEVMAGRADHAALGRLLDRAQALADVAGEDATSPRYCTWCVYEAALRALNSAWLCDQLGQGAADAPPAAQTGCADDASMYAAIAVSGGSWYPTRGGVGRWDWQTTDARLRRAVFWEWWLRDAVPAAWHKVQYTAA